MIKVLYITTASEPFEGGAEISLYMLISCFYKKSDIQVHIASPESFVYPFPENEVLRVHLKFMSLKRTINPLCLYGYYRNIKSVSLELKKYCLDNNIDIVHANGCKAALYAPEGLPLVCHLRDLRLPRMAALALGKKISVAIAISEAVAEVGRKALGVKTEVVSNPVGFIAYKQKDHNKASALVQLKDKIADKPFVLMAANFYSWKRHDVFLESFIQIKRSYPEMCAVIASGAGDDSASAICKAEVMQMINEYGLSDDVSCLTFEQYEMQELYNLASLLIHPPVEEPFGRVVAEAMLEGLPVIAANSAGPAEILNEGGGVLLDNPDAAHFAGAACRLIEDPEKMRHLGAEGKKIASERYSPEAHAAKIAEIYQIML